MPLLLPTPPHPPGGREFESRAKRLQAQGPRGALATTVDSVRCWVDVSAGGGGARASGGRRNPPACMPACLPASQPAFHARAARMPCPPPPPHPHPPPTSPPTHSRVHPPGCSPGLPPPLPAPQPRLPRSCPGGGGGDRGGARRARGCPASAVQRVRHALCHVSGGRQKGGAGGGHTRTSPPLTKGAAPSRWGEKLIQLLAQLTPPTPITPSQPTPPSPPADPPPPHHPHPAARAGAGRVRGPGHDHQRGARPSGRPQAHPGGQGVHQEALCHRSGLARHCLQGKRARCCCCCCCCCW